MESEDLVIQRHVTLSPSPLLRASLKFKQASRLDPVRSGAIFKQSAEEKEQQHLEGGKREEIRTLFETLCRESPAPRALASRHSSGSKDQVQLLMPPPKALPNQSQSVLEAQELLTDARTGFEEATEKGTKLGASTHFLEMGSESRRREQAEGSETPEKQESALDALQTSAVWEGDQMDFGHLPDKGEPPASEDISEAQKLPEFRNRQSEGAENATLEAETEKEGREREEMMAEGLEDKREGIEQLVVGQETELRALEESEGGQEGSKGVQEEDGNKQRSVLPKSPELTEAQKKKRASKILKDLSSPSLSETLLSPYSPQGHKKEAHGIEFTKRGRARLSPIAFWKNEGLERDKLQGGLPVGTGRPIHKQTSPAEKIKSPKATHKATPQLPRDETLCRRYDGKGWYCPSLHAPGSSMCAFHRDQAKRRALRAQLKGRMWHAKGRKRVARPANSEAEKKQHAEEGDVSERGQELDARASRKRWREAERGGDVIEGGGDITESGQELDARASRKRRREIEREGDVSKEEQPESEQDMRASRKRRREAVKETKQDESGVILVGHLLLAAPLFDTEVEEQMTRVLMNDPMEEDARTSDREKDEETGQDGNKASGSTEESAGAKGFGEEGDVEDLQPSDVRKESASKQEQDPQPEAGAAKGQTAEDLLRRDKNQPAQPSEEEQQTVKAQGTADTQGVGQRETDLDDESVAMKKRVEAKIAALRAQIEAEETELRRLLQQGSQGLPTNTQDGSALQN